MRRRSHRSAFAAATAITFLAFAGVILGALMASFALDVKRSAATADNTQLRQLLLAGAAAARDRLEDSATADSSQFELSLPATLDQDDHLSVTLTIGTPTSTATADIQATVGQSSARQRLTFRRTATTWQVVEVKLY